MDKITRMMAKRAELLKQAIKQAEKEEGTFLQGRLVVSSDRGYPRYYYVAEEKGATRVYITKDKIRIAKNLAQKEYNAAFISMAKRELSRLEKESRILSKDNADIVYEGTSEFRRKLIVPYLKTDEMYAEEWRKKDYKTNPYKPERKIYETKKGDKVRTKAEAIIADILFDLEIPYRYEQGVILKNGKIRYPDFTLLNKCTREEIYLEHLGLLDSEEYRADNLAKMDEYRASGIYLGKNLIITYETSKNPLDIGGIRGMLKEVFETR